MLSTHAFGEYALGEQSASNAAPPVDPTVPSPENVDAAKVAASRKVVFAGGTRVVAFGSLPTAIRPGGPYLQNGQWTIPKHPLDEFYCVGDFAIDVAETGSPLFAVEAIAEGVVVLEDPVVQGALVPIKLGGLDLAQGAMNFCTLRATLRNGEQLDRTIWFVLSQDVWWLNKDADDKRFYVGDIANILADSNTEVETVLPAVAVGVRVLEKAVAQGALLVVKLGDMDTSPDPTNYCTLPFLCTNSEKFFRTMHFKEVTN